MLLVLVAVACAKQAVVSPRPITELLLDSASVDFFGELQELLPTERVLCLYGRVSNDSAFVNFIKPTHMRTRLTHSATYDSCPKTIPSLIHGAQYLGTWHNHKMRDDVPWDDLCHFSQIDSNSFGADTEAVVEMVSCGRRKLIARGKDVK